MEAGKWRPAGLPVPSHRFDLVTEGTPILSGGSGMPALPLWWCTCQCCAAESYLSQLLVFMERLLREAPVRWLPVLGTGSRKTSKLSGPSHPGSSGEEAPQEGARAHPALLSTQPSSLPTSAECIWSRDLTSFHSLGPLLAPRPPHVGAEDLH